MNTTYFTKHTQWVPKWDEFMAQDGGMDTNEEELQAACDAAQYWNTSPLGLLFGFKDNRLPSEFGGLAPPEMALARDLDVRFFSVITDFRDSDPLEGDGGLAIWINLQEIWKQLKGMAR